MKQIQKKYAKAILKTPYKSIITATKHKYYIMEDAHSMRIYNDVVAKLENGGNPVV